MHVCSLILHCVIIVVSLLILSRIFEISPQTQKMFDKFSNASKEEITENEHFRSHALQVTESLSLAVSTLDDMDSLVLILKDLGSLHSTHNLQNAHFEVRCVTKFVCSL